MSKSTAQPTTKGWFSIQEAADYLGISQPTLFRWMKRGTLSFYKVGASTRFSKNGLDAVIKKTTGENEADIAATQCAACGHSVMIDGKLQGTGNLYFRPKKSKFWVFAEQLVRTRSRVCAACGYVQLNADVSKLRRLSKDRDNERV